MPTTIEIILGDDRGELVASLISGFPFNFGEVIIHEIKI